MPFRRSLASLVVSTLATFVTACSGGGASAGPLPAAPVGSTSTTSPTQTTTTPSPQPTASSPASSSSSSLVGRVIDDASGSAVANATIVIGSGAYTPSEVYRRFQAFGVAHGSARSRIAGTVLTANDGSFGIAAASAGLQQFQISAPGYATYNTGVTLLSGSKDLGTIPLHKLDSTEATWLALVNADRAGYGNAPVAFDQIAYEAASAHAADMAAKNYFSHEDPAGRKPYVRYAALGGIGFESENIGAGYASVTDVEAAFMGEAASKGGHFLNIEDAAHDWVGLAQATAPAGTSTFGTYYDQEFVTVAGVWDPSQIPASVKAGTTLRVDVLAPSSTGAMLGETLWEATPVAATPASGAYGYPAAATSVAPASLSRTGEFEFTLTASQPGLNELLVFGRGEPTTPFTISGGAIAMPIVWTT